MASLEQQALEELRTLCENSLWAFAQTVEPHRVYGLCHKEMYEWWQQCEELGITNTIALIPRDHQKSHAMAVWCTWKVTRDPTETIIYLSATTGLAARQLTDIKNILESPIYRKLWPEMINEREGLRTQWNEESIIVDHPKRRAAQLRDPTIAVAGLDTNTTGWHCSILIKDDVVVPDNAYEKAQRTKVADKCGQFASILSPGGLEWVVGTRYHQEDHYGDLIRMTCDEFDDDGNLIGEEKMYACFERVVETNGIFLWPRAARKSDGKLFGFDARELAKKRAKYTGPNGRARYRAQYYNDTSNDEDCPIQSNMFRYYEPEDITYKNGTYFYKNRELYLIAAMDFAFSLSKRADYSTIAVVGVDWERNVYVLDLARFKTNKTSIYFDKLADMHSKWGFKWVRCEVTQAQDTIVQYIKDELAKDETGRSTLRVEDFRPSRTEGSKEERIGAILQPRYDNRKVFHGRGGNFKLLEEELTHEHPPHDDLKDSVATAVSSEKVRYPRRPESEDDDDRDDKEHNVSHVAHGRFGGYV